MNIPKLRKKVKNYKKRFDRFIEEDPLRQDIWDIISFILIAASIYFGLRFLLQTPDPVVTVVSCSMVPNLDRGDFLILKGVNNISELTPSIIPYSTNGTIIVYYHPLSKKLIVHRLLRINPDNTLTTLGDNNPAPDPWKVPFEWVKGKVILRIPYIGYPRILISEWFYRLLGYPIPKYQCGIKIPLTDNYL